MRILTLWRRWYNSGAQSENLSLGRKRTGKSYHPTRKMNPLHRIMVPQQNDVYLMHTLAAIHYVWYCQVMGEWGYVSLLIFSLFFFFCGIVLMYILFFTGCDEWVEVFIEAEKSWICKYMFMHIYFMFLYYYYYLPILSPCF